MNIKTTIPDEAIPAWQYRVDQFNAGSGQPPVTIEQFAQLECDETTAQRVAAHEASILANLASNTRLMELGKAVASQPDKLSAVEAAVTTILNS